MADSITGLPLFDLELAAQRTKLTPDQEVSREYIDHCIGVSKVCPEPGVVVIFHQEWLSRTGRGGVSRHFVNGVHIRGNSCELERILVTSDNVTLVFGENVSETYPWWNDAVAEYLLAGVK